MRRGHAGRRCSVWLALNSACGVAIERTPAAAGAFELPQCVAVAAFDSPPNLAAAGHIVGMAMAEELWRSGRVQVIGPAEVAHALRAADIKPQQLGHPEALAHLARELGVETLLVGTVTRFAHAQSGDVDREPVMIAFSARLLDANTRRVLWATGVSARDRPYLLALPRSRAQVAEEAVEAVVAELLAGSPRSPRHAPCLAKAPPTDVRDAAPASDSAPLPSPPPAELQHGTDLAP